MRNVIKGPQLEGADLTVSELLTQWGITFTAIYTGEAKREDWVHDAWVIVFARHRVNPIHERFDFCTGTGRRKIDPISSRRIKSMGKMSDRYRKQVLDEYSNPVAPTAASVLYSLLLDSSAANETFHDWCDDCGYDADSIKALKTYDQCLGIAKQVGVIFTREQMAQISALLDDY